MTQRTRVIAYNGAFLPGKIFTKLSCVLDLFFGTKIQITRVPGDLGPHLVRELKI